MNGSSKSSNLGLVQITDTHFPSRFGTLLRGVDADDGLAAVLELPSLVGDAPDLIIHTGDLIQKEDSDEPGERERRAALAYARLSRALSHLNEPVYCLPGNHDEPKVMERALSAGPLVFQRHIVRDSWQIVMLDSSIRGTPGGHLEEAELQLLGDTLAANREHAIVCMHHAPVSISSYWLDTMTIDNAEELFALLEQHDHVRAVVFGHIHHEFESRRGPIAILGAPSTSLQFTPGENEPVLDSIGPGLRYLELAPDGGLTTRVNRAATPVQGGREEGMAASGGGRKR